MGTSYFSTEPGPTLSGIPDSQIAAWLSRIPPIASLPESEWKALAHGISIEIIPEGTVLFLRGRSRVENVYLIKDGILEIQDQPKDRLAHDIIWKHPPKKSDILCSRREGFLQYLAKQSSTLSEGEMYGGESILMNGGVANRTVKALRETTLYVIPGQMFLDICKRYPVLARFFAGTFSQKMMMDAAYASIIVSRQARAFLENTLPFCFLPESEIARIASELTIAFYPREHEVFTQGISRVDALYIIQTGAAERYFEAGNPVSLLDRMGEGDLFGGISILLNNAIAIRSLKVTEDTYCYIWPKERFLDTCSRFEPFRAYFTDTFGKRMLDRFYAGIVAQMIHPGQGSLPPFDQSIEGIYQRKTVHCPMDMPIQLVAERMSLHRCSSILVTGRQGDVVGIVTDSDLRKKVITEGLGIQEPIATIMSSPLRSVSQKIPLFDALMVMMQHSVKHLAVTDSEKSVVGILTNRDLLATQGYSPVKLMREIQVSGSLKEIAHLHKQLPAVVQHLMRAGAKAGNLTRLVTVVSDTILVKLIEMAIKKMGKPPCRFALMVLGSEGRKEQTLKTDQDNAIIYEDPPVSAVEAVRSYFLALGETVCAWLDQTGYRFCQGGVMAKNPMWCQPVSVWKQYFSTWTHQAEAKDLLQASIFFDFRGGYGDLALVSDLRRYLMGTLLGWAGFFRHLTENALYFRPPVGFFRNFVVASKGEHRDSFDIKSAIMPIIDIIRIYALKHGVVETSTTERMLQLYQRKKLSWDMYNELEHAYGFLMQLRFSHQVNALLIDKAEPNNFINPKRLTQIERTMLKEIFIRIERMQQRIRFEFIGS